MTLSRDAVPFSRRIRARLFRALERERGHRLDAALKRTLQRSFGAELGNIVVHDSRVSHAIADVLNAQAFAFANHVGCARGALDDTAENVTQLVSHEVAHVVQWRIGVCTAHDAAREYTSAPRALLEWEAHAAALAVSRGEQYRCRLAHRAGRALCWDRAGHYHTPYLVFLNAGAKPEVAANLALWCWLPDQVNEFEAVGLMRPSWQKLPWGSHELLGASASDSANEVLKKEGYAPFGAYDLVRGHSGYVRTVHMGLHVLNGGAAAAEVEKRTRWFVDSRNVPPLFRGLGLHPFGDCFAHRDFGSPGRLFGPYSGHAPTHDPDNIWDTNRISIYQDYVSKLSELARQYTGQSPKVSVNDLLVALSPMLAKQEQKPATGTASGPLYNVADASAAARKLGESLVARDEGACCDHIRKVATDLVRASMTAYEPKEDEVPWEDYFKRHQARITSDSGGMQDADKIFCRIMQYAGEWCGMPLKRLDPNVKLPRRRPIS